MRRCRRRRLRAAAVLGLRCWRGRLRRRDHRRPRQRAPGRQRAGRLRRSAPDSLDPALACSPGGAAGALAGLHAAADLPPRGGRERHRARARAGRADAEAADEGRTYSFTLPHGPASTRTGGPLRAADFARAIERVARGSNPAARRAVPRDRGDRRRTTRSRDGPHPPAAPRPRVPVRCWRPSDRARAAGHADARPGAAPAPGIGPYRLERPSRGAARFVLTRRRGSRSTACPAATWTRWPGRRGRPRRARTRRRSPAGWTDQARPAAGLDAARAPVEVQGPLPGVRHARRSPTWLDLDRRSRSTDVRVRRAVAFALDVRDPARLLRRTASDPGLQRCCPPQVPGYERLEPCPFGDPRGRRGPRAARQLVERAGADGGARDLWTRGDDRGQARCSATGLDTLRQDRPAGAARRGAARAPARASCGSPRSPRTAASRRRTWMVVADVGCRRRRRAPRAAAPRRRRARAGRGSTRDVVEGALSRRSAPEDRRVALRAPGRRPVPALPPRLRTGLLEPLPVLS